MADNPKRPGKPRIRAYGVATPAEAKPEVKPKAGPKAGPKAPPLKDNAGKFISRNSLQGRIIEGDRSTRARADWYKANKAQAEARAAARAASTIAGAARRSPAGIAVRVATGLLGGGAQIDRQREPYNSGAAVLPTPRQRLDNLLPVAPAKANVGTPVRARGMGRPDGEVRSTITSTPYERPQPQIDQTSTRPKRGPAPAKPEREGLLVGDARRPIPAERVQPTNSYLPGPAERLSSLIYTKPGITKKAEPFPRRDAAGALNAISEVRARPAQPQKDRDRPAYAKMGDSGTYRPDDAAPRGLAGGAAAPTRPATPGRPASGPASRNAAGPSYSFPSPVMVSGVRRASQSPNDPAAPLKAAPVNAGAPRAGGVNHSNTYIQPSPEAPAAPARTLKKAPGAKVVTEGGTRVNRAGPPAALAAPAPASALARPAAPARPADVPNRERGRDAQSNRNPASAGPSAPAATARPAAAPASPRPAAAPATRGGAPTTSPRPAPAAVPRAIHGIRAIRDLQNGNASAAEEKKKKKDRYTRAEERFRNNLAGDRGR